MSYISNKDYNLEVKRGNVAGVEAWGMYATSGSILTSSKTISSHPTANVDQSSIFATPATVKVSSTSANDTSGGTGLRTLTLIGLDSSGVEQSETITMNGQTAVNSVNEYKAINGATFLTYGSNNGKVGTIYVGTGTVTAGVPATLFYVNTTTMYYTVPTLKTLHLMEFAYTPHTDGSDTTAFIQRSSDAAAFTGVCFVGGAGRIPVNTASLGPLEVLRVMAYDSTTTITASASVTGYLIDNSSTNDGDAWVLEDGSGYWLLEDDTGVWLLE